ncbi:hypothetical protein KOR42_47680 [Thalassoglobus neptunius]|uniref:Uncharacterized protein n=1 Tax=Thalassoglobus neptunius TaxID=1938619 RepID=A0A5C5VTN4_9PLAN|nr:hypothetical protein [Thalassoglobus neptunius]TWT41497.1 hypothetical protein KOR42_47680 [Thalassoglobus neptunius]
MNDETFVFKSPTKHVSEFVEQVLTSHKSSQEIVDEFRDQFTIWEAPEIVKLLLKVSSACNSAAWYLHDPELHKEVK